MDPLNSITVQSSSSYLHRPTVYRACITSVYSTNALKAKEAVFLPHYSPESLIRIQILYTMKAGSGARDGKNPLKIQQEATCCPRRGRPLP